MQRLTVYYKSLIQLMAGSICLIAFNCTSPRLIQVPNHTGNFSFSADYADYNLYISTFNVFNLAEQEDHDQVRRLKDRFIQYLSAQNRFKQIYDGPPMITDNRSFLTATVDIEPTYTSNRTWFFEVITFYPFIGLWPISPNWGEANVELTLSLFDGYGTLLQKIFVYQSENFSKTFYSVYTSKHIEDAFEKCYQRVFTDISQKLQQNQPRICAYVDSILLYHDSYRFKRPSSAVDNPSLAVVELNAYGVSQMDALAMSNRLTTEIFKTGHFTVLEREKIQEILIEQGFQQTGCTSSECLVEAGKLLNVQMIVGGSVSKIGHIFTVELRLIDVETGKIISVANEDIQGDIGEVLTHGIRRATVKLIR